MPQFTFNILIALRRLCLTLYCKIALLRFPLTYPNKTTTLPYKSIIKNKKAALYKDSLLFKSSQSTLF